MTSPAPSPSSPSTPKAITLDDQVAVAPSTPPACDTTLPVLTSQSLSPSQFRALLKENPDSVYLGSASMSESLEWIRDGHTDRLVGKSTALIAAVGGEAVDKEATNNPDNAVETVVQEPAVLSIVACVSEKDLWVATDGFWSGPKAYPDGRMSRFEDIKMSFMVEPVVCDGYEQDWMAYITNAGAIQGKVASRNSLRSGFLLPKGIDGLSKLKFRHAIFSEVDDSESQAEDEDPEGENDERTDLATWSFDNWPVRASAQDALETLKEAKTHQLNPLPLFGEDGKLVSPNEYRKRLQGATVAIKFMLVHHFIKNKNFDSFAADIVNIDIISPAKPKPKVVVQSPSRKRKYSMRSGGGSPSKKRAYE
ncbi:hypothetical protein ONZ45_g3411 [Pleurotus djamor]|nr:hypothetical protein ONZ45_g3411 [Pleurotus djamor]